MKQKKGKKDVMASVLGQQTNIEEKAKENRQKKKKKEVYIVLVIHWRRQLCADLVETSCS